MNDIAKNLKFCFDISKFKSMSQFCKVIGIDQANLNKKMSEINTKYSFTKNDVQKICYNLGLRKELNFLVNSLKVSSTLQSGYAFGTAGIISTLNDILKFDKTDPYQVRIYFEKLIRSLLSTGFKMKNQIIFSGDQNFKEFIDYGSGSMGILLTLKKIIDNQEFDPIFKDL